MSDTCKAGKRAWRSVRYKPDNPLELHPIIRTWTRASTEKIRRRCRHIWRRQLNKLRRKADKAVIQEGSASQAPGTDPRSGS